jgi:hypothetical protein
MIGRCRTRVSGWRRRSSGVRRVVDAAAGKSILFFPARHDHWLVQTGDGYAARFASRSNIICLVDFHNHSVGEASTRRRSGCFEPVDWPAAALI